MPEQLCQLRIIRGGDWRPFPGKYDVLVNWSYMGLIAKDSVLDLRVSPGVHLVHIHHIFADSNQVGILASPERRVELEIKTIFGWKYWLLAAARYSMPSLVLAPTDESGCTSDDQAKRIKALANGPWSRDVTNGE